MRNAHEKRFRQNTARAFGRAGICLCLALTGCATTRYATAYCLTQAQYDELKRQKPVKVHDQLNGQADHDLKPVAGRLIRVEAWGDGLMVVLGGCVEPVKH